MKNTFIYTLTVLSMILSITIFSAVSVGETGSNDEIGFKYGIIGKKSMQDRKLFPVEDGCEMHASEMIRINYELVAPGYFYLIWGTSGGDYALLTVSQMTDSNDPGVIQKTDWYELDDEVGEETLYLIASPERLLRLETLFNNLMNGKESSQSDINLKIAGEIETYQKRETGGNKTLKSRKEKPIDGGIVFRSAGINENSISKELTGSGILIKAVKIDHKK